MTIDHIKQSTFAWNTGRSYSGFGQRMAAAQFGHGVFLADYDRMIQIYLPYCSPSTQEIMRRYDAGECHLRKPEGMEWSEVIEVFAWLNEQAQAQIETISVFKLDSPVQSGDWHDKPLRYQVCCGKDRQLFATKKAALKFAGLWKRHGLSRAVQSF